MLRCLSHYVAVLPKALDYCTLQPLVFVVVVLLLLIVLGSLGLYAECVCVSGARLVSAKSESAGGTRADAR